VAEAPTAPVDETRRTVSIVFSDLQGSTDLGERLDSEALREVLGFYFDRMRAVLERHGGTVEKYIGDAIMAVFGLPTVHEDDALRAVRAAFEMCEALHRLNDELERGWGVRLVNRTGVNTGEVVAGDAATGQRLVTGDPVNVAARLEQAAPPVEVLIGETTYRLVAPHVHIERLEPLTLKGKSEPVPAYRLLDVRGGDDPGDRPQLPMVGRDEELLKLRQAFAAAAAGGGAHVVTLVASAGTGKSRLLQEFLGDLPDALAYTGHCPSYGEGITFWPIAEIVRAAARIDRDDDRQSAREKLLRLTPEPAVADALAAVTGLADADQQVAQIFAGVAAMLGTFSATSPVVVVLEDIHWAQSTLLDLVGYLRQTLTFERVLLICTARPEFLDAEPDWMADAERAERVVLAPLLDTDGAAIVRAILGDGPLLDDVVHVVVSAASGNPLFIEQTVAMLIDDGALQRDGAGRWRPTRRLEAVSVPSSVAAVLAARLERLPAAERSVLQRASVMGHVFYRDAIVENSPEGLRAYVEPSIGGLVAKGLVQPESSYLADQDAFRFHHALIRDVAYHELLKRTRAELHESFAGWLEGAAGTRAQEYEEVVGYHLEQAFKTRCELGPPDERVREVGRQGGRKLAQSGSRALSRADLPAAANLLGRATELLDRESQERRTLLADRAEALWHLGEFATAHTVLDEAELLAAELSDERLYAQATIERLLIRWVTESGDAYGEMLEPVAGAIKVLERVQDHRHLANAWRLVGLLHNSGGRYTAAEQALARAIEHADQSGDRRTQVRAMSTYVQNVTEGPTPVADAIAMCIDLQMRTTEDRWTQALVNDQLARLSAMRGDFTVARTHYRKSQQLLEALGARVMRAVASDSAGEVELLAGDPVGAERELRRGYDVLLALDSKNYLSTVAARLALAVAAQARIDEAEELTRVSETAAAEDDVMSHVLWRTARAQCRSATAPEEGLLLARSAVELARTVDSPSLLGAALLAEAEALLSTGLAADAADLAREARDVFAAKGFTVGVDQAARLTTSVPVVDVTVVDLTDPVRVSLTETRVPPA
jgi:class 3 adenylate cyclase/predicted ATPase